MAGDITTLLMWTKNHNHMMYGSWDTEWDRHNILSFWVINCPFIPQTIRKIKILKKWKKKKTPGDITILHMCTKNDNHMMYGSWDMERNGQSFLSLSVIFSAFTPQSLTNHIWLIMKCILAFQNSQENTCAEESFLKSC